MKKIVSMILLATALTSTAAEWKVVYVKDGEPVSVGTIANTKVYTPDPAKNEYPMDYVFPDVDKMYWKKNGNDWVAMNADEKLVVDNAKKQKTLDEAVADVDMDALFTAIAESIKKNDKTAEAVKANFKAAVDPKKADKAWKSKSKSK